MNNTLLFHPTNHDINPTDQSVQSISASGLSRTFPKSRPSVATHALNTSTIRYAQCWEDADILIAAAALQEGQRVLSICSAGDNTLALLSQNPAAVTAIDSNPAQIACLEIRVAAFKQLQYAEVLELLGAKPSARRTALYGECRRHLSVFAQAFWDNRLSVIERGVINAGRFEHYFELFRTLVLPLVHPRHRMEKLLRPGATEPERKRFFQKEWNSLAWRLMFRVFFSRRVMGTFGRERTYFKYAEHDLPDFLLRATEHALTELAPSENPYLSWILKGRYGTTLPFYLRKENFDSIKNNLDKLSWQLCSLQEYIELYNAIDQQYRDKFDAFNLSDVFEYVPTEEYELLLTQLSDMANKGARLVYWNMVVPRACPARLRGTIGSRPSISESLFQLNKTFFYTNLIVEEVL